MLPLIKSKRVNSNKSLKDHLSAKVIDQNKFGYHYTTDIDCQIKILSLGMNRAFDILIGYLEWLIYLTKCLTDFLKISVETRTCGFSIKRFVKPINYGLSIMSSFIRPAFLVAFLQCLLQMSTTPRILWAYFAIFYWLKNWQN